MRRVVIVATLVFFALTVFAYTQWLGPLRRGVFVGAGSLAKQMCSCVYVAGRDFEACRADQFTMLDPVRVEPLDDQPGMRAYVPGLSERRATFSEGFGCTLE